VSTSVAYASIGSDGILAIMYTGSTTGSQVNERTSTFLLFPLCSQKPAKRQARVVSAVANGWGQRERIGLIKSKKYTLSKACVCSNGVQVLNTNNIVCLTTNTIWWLSGGYGTNTGFTGVAGRTYLFLLLFFFPTVFSLFVAYPSALNSDCFVGSSASSCLARWSMGGKDSSGYAYFMYHGSDSHFYGTKFQQQ
jgi:hypothetical protein